MIKGAVLVYSDEKYRIFTLCPFYPPIYIEQNIEVENKSS